MGLFSKFRFDPPPATLTAKEESLASMVETALIDAVSGKAEAYMHDSTGRSYLGTMVGVREFPTVRVVQIETMNQNGLAVLIARKREVSVEIKLASRTSVFLDIEVLKHSDRSISFSYKDVDTVTKHGF